MFLKTPWTVCPTPPNSAIQRPYYCRFVLAVKFPPTAATHRPAPRPISSSLALCLRLPGLGTTAKGFPPKLFFFSSLLSRLIFTPHHLLPYFPPSPVFSISSFSFLFLSYFPPTLTSFIPSPFFSTFVVLILLMTSSIVSVLSPSLTDHGVNAPPTRQHLTD